MLEYGNESDSDGDDYGNDVTTIAKAPKIAMKIARNSMILLLLIIMLILLVMLLCHFI